MLYLCYWSLPRFVRVVWHGAQLVGIANFNASVSLLDDADQSCVMSIGGGIKLASTWNQTLFGACGFFPRSVSTCLCLWYFTSLHLHSCADIFVIRLSPRSFTLVSWASCVCDFKDVTRSRAWLSCVVEENDLPRHRMQIYTNNFLRWEVRLGQAEQVGAPARTCVPNELMYDVGGGKSASNSAVSDYTSCETFLC